VNERTPRPGRWLALGVLCLSLLVIGFDMTILNVAIPTLARQLHASTGQQEWIVDAFVVALAGSLMPAGAVGDRFGRKRVLIVGYLIFGAASAWCALAGNTGTLIAARALMGVGAAVIMPLSMAMIPALFAPGERQRALSLWTTGTALGLPLGPIIGGWLLQTFWWGSVFLVNVPVIMIVVIAAALLLPESAPARAGRLDWPGALISAFGIVAVVYGVIQGPESGWGSPQVLGAFTIGATTLVLFVVRERSTATPLVDLRLLADRRFLWTTVATTLLSFPLSGLLFVINPYLQVVLGYSAVGSAIRLLPLVLALAAGAFCANGARTRFGARNTIASGLALMAAGQFVLATSGSSTGYAFVAVCLALFGFGVGVSISPAIAVMMESIPKGVGAGSALNQTFRQLGSALGVAIMGSMLDGIYRAHAADGVTGLTPQATRVAQGSVVAAAQTAHDLGSSGRFLAQRRRSCLCLRHGRRAVCGRRRGAGGRDAHHPDALAAQDTGGNGSRGTSTCQQVTATGPGRPGGAPGLSRCHSPAGQ
jgi:EmrB/QacA subfamily drug resistance transporter